MTGGVVQPTDAQIERETLNSTIEAILYQCDRGNVSFSWLVAALRGAHLRFALPQAPLQAEPVPVVASEPMDAENWAELYRLREAVKGPPGYATWQDAATAERIRRVKAERATPQAEPAVAEQAWPTPDFPNERRQHQTWAETFYRNADKFSLGDYRISLDAWNERARIAALASQSTPEPAVAEQAREALRLLFRDAMDWGRSYGQRLNLTDMTIMDVSQGFADKALSALASQSTPPPARPDRTPYATEAEGEAYTDGYFDGLAARTPPPESAGPPKNWRGLLGEPPESAGQGLSDAQICEVEHAVEALRQIAGGQIISGDTLERVADIRRARGIATIAHRRLDAVLAILAANPTAQPDGGSDK